MNLQETIRRILRQEVNEANLRPNENTDKLIDRWLEKLFSGSKMYYEESYKTILDGVIKVRKLHMLYYFLMKTKVFIPINDQQVKEILLKVI
jgi:hypothetical protein